MTDSLPPASATPAPPSPEPRSVESAELFQGARVVEISHAGETYRLLLTRNNRLILQK
jgi:hemin uptake protein HemP